MENGHIAGRCRTEVVIKTTFVIYVSNEVQQYAKMTRYSSPMAPGAKNFAVREAQEVQHSRD
jgi:hypothetical protein